ncbi:conotoxin Vc6.6-like [Convolutriloba macropyga]|uniref:conotoxin Vc6.6-like n=1 Tax=Convolutriloba macropyga TaxID=536237 RepID=UPI003F528DFD
MLRQIVLILAIVVIAQADFLGRRYPNWNNINERDLYQRRHQELNAVKERGEIGKRCFDDGGCGPGTQCVMFYCAPK